MYHPNFNSIKVRLEPVLSDLFGDIPAYFNSIKVRLELSLFFLTSPILTDFNSIKVRLEQNAYYTPQGVPEFQFHKGTIRTGQEGGDILSMFISIP